MGTTHLDCGCMVTLSMFQDGSIWVHPCYHHAALPEVIAATKNLLNIINTAPPPPKVENPYYSRGNVFVVDENENPLP